MELRVNNRVSNQAFCGLLGKDSIVGVQNIGPGIEVSHEVEHYPFLRESQESVDAVVKKNTTSQYYTINSNGIGAQVHKTKVINKESLPFTETEYKAYKNFKSTSEATVKVEKGLAENGLNKYLNKGIISGVKKFVYRLLHI